MQLSGQRFWQLPEQSLVLPQPSLTVPAHCRAPHVRGFGVQPHLFGLPAPLQVFTPLQVFGQLTTTPQPLVTLPHCAPRRGQAALAGSLQTH